MSPSARTLIGTTTALRAGTTKAAPAKSGGKAGRPRLSSTPAPKKVSWQDYSKPARRKGYVSLRGTAGSWSGYVILKGGRVAPEARLGFRRVLASWRTGKQVDIPERLIRMLTRVSDTFGGSPLRIVGGVREHSFAKSSHHYKGEAVDFSVPGVPNEALRDYLRTIENTGVGYYPHSSFVHVDIRNHRSYWVDYSRPGQRPVYVQKAKTETPARTLAPHADQDPAEQELAEELDQLQASAKKAFQVARAPGEREPSEQTSR